VEYVRLLLLLLHALVMERRHDEASQILHETMAHIIIGDCRMGAALCVAGMKLNIMRSDPSEALYMFRSLVQGQEIQQSEWPKWEFRWEMMSRVLNTFQSISKDGCSVSSDAMMFIQRRVVYYEQNNETLPWSVQMTRANQVDPKFVHISFTEYVDMLKRWHDDIYIENDNEKYNERKAIVYLCMVSTLCKCLNLKRTYLGTALLKAISFMTLYQELRIKTNESEVLYNFGRLAQYVGLLDLAAAYYRDCIALGTGDSRMHAAFNLHLIYRNSGEDLLAMKLMSDVLSV